jgi:hypothetical protein
LVASLSTTHSCLLLLALERRLHESSEQRVRLHRPRLELGVELAADEPRVLG